ncbi:MAG: putative lipid II flippase FtsW [Patescibacteria group bacterium]|nr:putative lipid II flippase FtsW [Patescibacteria group bacterium]
MRSEGGKIDKKFLGLLIAILAFGLLMLLSASGPLGYQQFHDSSYFFKHQLLNGVLPGVILFAFFAWFDYKKLEKFAPTALIGSIVLLLLVYMPGIGQHFGGSGRWISLGFVTFQPSEFVKVGFLIYVAAWLAKRYEYEAKTLEGGLFPFLLSLSIIILLLVMQPNTGSMAVIVGASLATYFIAGAPLTWFAAIGASAVGFVALLVKLTPYRTQRFMTFLHPELDPQGVGYHINQAYLAIGSGGLFGLGYGHSRQKYLYLPEVAGDSIFAVIAEEMGMFVAVLFLIAMGVFVHRIFVIAKRCTDPFGRFLAVGIGAWIGIQTFFNVASMIGLMPITGVTLPFVSYGSSAFVALSIACGIVASISKGNNLWRASSHW